MRLTYRQVAALWERYSRRLQWEIELSIKTNPMFSSDEDEDEPSKEALMKPGRGGIDSQDPEWDHSLPTLDATRATPQILAALGLNVKVLPKQQI